jgi:hypothetical protein
MPNATSSGARVFAYSEVASFHVQARTNHSHDPVPYLPTLIAGFDPRPWEEQSPSFTMPTQAEWELALQQVRLLWLLVACAQLSPRDGGASSPGAGCTV